MNSTILVLGGTGLQGGAVARRLLRDGWHVRFVTRDPGSAKARQLAALGAEPVQAELSDAQSIAKACRDAHGVFSVQDFWAHGLKAEVRQGINVVDAARQAGVNHLVYASVGGTDRTAGLGISHFDSKAAIEKYLAASGVPHTILRPVSFCENFTTPVMLQRIFEQGVVRFPFPGDRPFQLLAVEDEADFVASAFARPELFIGRALEIGSDERPLSELAALIGAAIGRDVAFQEVDMDSFAAFVSRTEAANLTAETKVGASLVQQLAWNRSSAGCGWAADLMELRRLLPSLRSLEDWVASVDWFAGRKGQQ